MAQLTGAHGSVPDKPKRRWYQFHLQTLVVLHMLAAMVVAPPLAIRGST